MQSIYGQKSTFTASDENLRINIEDLVQKYPDYKFPVLKRLNGKILKKEVLSHKYEWSERDLRPIQALLVNATLTDSVTAAIVDTAGAFNERDIIQNKRTGERILVTYVSGGVNLTFTRGFQGTTAAAMLANDIFVRVGNVSPQGAITKTALTYGSEDMFNYTHIFDDSVFMSNTQYEAFIHGDETQAERIERVQQELMEALQFNLLLGIRSYDAGEKRGTLGGIKFFVDTYAPDNTIDFGASWSSDITVLNKFEDAVQQVALKMGDKPTIYATYKALRRLRLVQDDTIRTTKSEKSRGIGVVDNYLSGMGELDIVQVIERTGIMDDYIFFVDEKRVGYKPMKNRGWFTEKRPYDGSGKKWAVEGEYTVKVATPKASVAYLHNLGIS